MTGDVEYIGFFAFSSLLKPDNVTFYKAIYHLRSLFTSPRYQLLVNPFDTFNQVMMNGFLKSMSIIVKLS